MLYHEMILELLSMSIPLGFVIYIAYRYRIQIKNDISGNLKSRFFSIILGAIASVLILFVFHCAILFLDKIGFSPDLLKDEEKSFLIKTALTVLIATIFIIVFKFELEERAKATLEEMNKRYKELSGYAVKYFEQMYNFRDSFEDNLIFNEVIKNQQILGREKKFVISLSTYLDIIVKFLENGYELKSINSTKLPFWFSSDETDKPVIGYRDFLAKHKERKDKLTRITYYKDKEWIDNTVGCIYIDMLKSEKTKEEVVKWILTLISNIDYHRADFTALLGYEIEKDINFIILRDDKKYIGKIKELCEAEATFKKFDEYIREHSPDMTKVVNTTFKQIMGENGCYHCDVSKFEGRFFDDEKEVGYFRKDDSQFALKIIGAISSTVTLQIITDNDAVAKISENIESLIKESHAS